MQPPSTGSGQAFAPTPDELKNTLIEKIGLSKEKQENFLRPAYTLADPFLFRDMEKAVERIHVAIEHKEHIGIYSDYDCDGIPGAVVLLDFFKVLGVLEYVHVYIPDRHDEGYGVNRQGITELQQQKVTLMITVDVGITALAEVADAQSRGIDVIVTDHHSPLEILPASLVIHPQVGAYPEKHLCGAATAFMLVRAFLQRYGNEYKVPEGWEKWLLDLVGFATLSDMVSLTEENRTLVVYGMMVMKKTRRVGLQALFAANSIDMQNLTESDLTFTVAPRLNAASRMASPLLAFELLSTTDRSRAIALVHELTKINDERKLLVARIVKEAHGRLEARSPSDDDLPQIVVIGDLAWRPAVLGLVAGKLSETYNRSFFVWGEGGDGMLKGSCRMLVVHHAAELMNSLPEGALLHGGGHQAAGGFAVAKEQVHFLEEALNTVLQAMGSSKEEKMATPSVSPLSLPLSCASVRHLVVIRQFAPFGVDNPEPLFLFENVIVNSTKKFGKAKEHLECSISDATGNATAFTFFAASELVQKIQAGQTISIMGTLEAGWHGGARIRIKEIL